MCSLSHPQYHRPCQIKSAHTHTHTLLLTCDVPLPLGCLLLCVSCSQALWGVVPLQTPTHSPSACAPAPSRTVHLGPSCHSGPHARAHRGRLARLLAAAPASPRPTSP